MIFRELILTISFAILATLAAALTLVPMLAAQLARIRFRSGLEQSFLIRGFNRGIGRLQRHYVNLLRPVLKFRYVTIVIALLAGIGIARIGADLGNEFLPQVDDGGVGIRMVLPSGTPPAETDAAAREIESVIMDMPHVDTMFALVGGHLGGGIINERPGTSNIRVQLTPARERPDMSAGQWVAEAQQRLDALDLPGARVSVRPPAIRGLQFSPGGADFSISLVGDELADMREYARDIAALLQGIPGLEGVEVGREDQSPLMRILVDRERAADLGLRVSEVGRAVRNAVADVGQIMAEVEARMADFDLPEQYSLIYSGQWETIQETNRELRTVVILALFLVFVVMAVQYERLTNPLVILTAAPLALFGVVSLLALTQTSLSAPVLIGVVLLIGIVVNNAILLVEYIEIGRRQMGLALEDAVYRAAEVRLRPILMTTLTTILGMLPLAIGFGEGAEIMHPLALAVVGGLLSAMFLTLFIVPAFYMIINGFAERARSMLFGS